MKTLRVTQILDSRADFLDKTTPNYYYRVAKVSNSTTPNIAQDLTQKELEVYCKSDAWEVTIT